MEKELSGIYQIKNLINDKIYVGSASCICNRWAVHKHDLRNNIHANSHLQNAFNKYGEDNFVFEVLEYLEKDEVILTEREDFYINNLEAYKRDKGYNFRSKAQRIHHSEDGKRRISEAVIKFRTGKSYVDLVGEEKAKEWKKNNGKAQLGKKHPHKQETKDLLSKIQSGQSYIDKVGEKRAKEWIEKTRKSNTGKKRSQEYKDSVSGENNGFYGKTHSEEARKKISEAGKGRIAPNRLKIPLLKYDLDGNFVEEVMMYTLGDKKGNIRACCDGKKKSVYGFMWKMKTDNYPLKIEELNRMTRKGTKNSEETRFKISESNKGKVSWNKGIKKDI